MTSLILFSTSALERRALATSPAIIRHDAYLMQNEIGLNIAWQSEEPVIKIIVSAGKEQIIIDKNIDNERNEAGYSGQIDIVVPAYTYNAASKHSMYMSRQTANQSQQSSVEMFANSMYSSNEVVQYTVQLVDENNQRSILLKGKIYRDDPAVHQSAHQPQSNSTNSTTTNNIKAGAGAQQSMHPSSKQADQQPAQQSPSPTTQTEEIPVVSIPGL